MKSYRSWKEKLILYFKGVTMGAADVVPGVSGGTIAFVTGIYSSLIEAIASIQIRHLRHLLLAIYYLSSPQKRVEHQQALSTIHWHFLIPLGLGILSAILTLAHLIPYWLQNYPVQCYALFFGLIAASAWLPFRIMQRSKQNLLILGVTFLITFMVLQPASNFAGSTHSGFVFLSGMIAVCALILPGISGSYILVLLGQYELILSAVNTRDLPMLATFIAGMALGLFTFIRVLKFFMQRFFSQTMAALTGLMLGSLRVIWPFEYLPPRENWQDHGFSVILATIVGALAVILLEKTALWLDDPDQNGTVLNSFGSQLK